MTSTHYELRFYRPDGSWSHLSEGLGVVNTPIEYVSARGARAGLRRLELDELIPHGGRTAIMRVQTEEIDEFPSTKPRTDTPELTTAP
jgi:hypothetical protein